MRLFIALPVDEALQSSIGKGIGEAGASHADVKWVDKNNLHLTIKFLGDQPETIVPQLLETLKLVSTSASPFSLAFTQVGYFPNPQRPRVVWLGVGGELMAANQLAISVDQQLYHQLNIPPDSKRKWHLTLGRIRSDRNWEVLQPGLSTIFSPLQGKKWQINSFSLYQSTLTPKGPIYKQLGTFSLLVGK